MVAVTVRAPIRPTEIPERVAEAAGRFFPGEAEVKEGEVVIKGTNIEDFRSRVWELRIIDTVRGSLLGGVDGKTLRFRLSKQAAAAGKVSIPVARHPLGELDIKVVVDDDDLWDDAEALAWWICPETADGEIVSESD